MNIKRFNFICSLYKIRVKLDQDTVTQLSSTKHYCKILPILGIGRKGIILK